MYEGDFEQIGWIEPLRRFWFFLKLKLTRRNCEICGCRLQDDHWLICEKEECIEQSIPF